MLKWSCELSGFCSLYSCMRWIFVQCCDLAWVALSAPGRSLLGRCHTRHLLLRILSSKRCTCLTHSK
jgi:hypothetical protein